MRLAPWRLQTRPAPWLVSVSTRVAAWLALAARPLSPPVTLMSIPACMYSIRVSHLITAVCELRGMLSTGEGRASYEYRGEYEREDKAVRVRIILRQKSGGAIRVPCVDRAPSRRGPSDSRLSETPTDSTAWCVTAVGLGAVVLGRGGRRFGYGSDTLAPPAHPRPDCVTAGRREFGYGFTRTVRFEIGRSVCAVC